jgi:hypothetical protein
MRGPFFALLFAIYPVLYIAASNTGQASFATVLIAVTVTGGASALLLLLLRLVFASWSRAALGVAVIVLWFFTYGPVHTSIEGTFLDSLTGTAVASRLLQFLAPHLHSVMTAMWLVTLLPALWTVGRIPHTWVPAVAYGCNSMALVLMTLIAVQSVAGRAAVMDTADRPRRAIRGLSTSVLGYNPDIYTIVLDGYAREDVLNRYYRFDNSEFLRGLEKRGFVVSTASHANYNWTFLSLASSLNMDYLQRLMGDQITPANESRAAVYDAIRNNEVARFFRQRGYRVVHFQTTWGATLHNPYADVQVTCHRSPFNNEFHRVVAEASWLKALQSRMSADLAQCYLSNLETLGRMGLEPGPKFVFAHFVPPHHPYLFDRHGNVLRNANLSNQFEFQRKLWEEKAPYIDQLVYMNRRITEAVDRILAASPRPPIIVLGSDHGPNFDRGLSREEKVRVRLANLSAFLLPAAPAGLMPNGGSAVNQFRRVLNYYFEAELDPLPDRYYFSEYATPYGLVEVDPLKPTLTARSRGAAVNGTSLQGAHRTSVKR